MRVLLVVGHTDSLFTNGIVQQVHFTRASLHAAGVETVVAATTPPIAAYADIGIDTVQLAPDSDLSGFDVVVFVSTNLVVNAAGSEPFLRRLKAQGTRLVSMLCGNYYYLLQEQFVLGQHDDTRFGESLLNPYIDEYWALETYRAYRPFMQALLGKPLRILPYCWSADIITRYAERESLQAGNTPHRRGALRLVVAEPNVSIHKSALVPVLIANGVIGNRTGAAGDGHLLILGGKNLRHDMLAPFVPLYAARRVEAYPRMNVLNVLDELRHKDHPVLFVCHHMHNGLNFLHFELTWLGYPVVHNAAQLASTGGYYPGEDVGAGVARVRALLDEDCAAARARRERERRTLAWYAPEAARVVGGYRDALSALIA